MKRYLIRTLLINRNIPIRVLMEYTNDIPDIVKEIYGDVRCYYLLTEEKQIAIKLIL